MAFGGLQMSVVYPSLSYVFTLTLDILSSFVLSVLLRVRFFDDYQE